jgi:chemotaxis protein MotA
VNLIAGWIFVTVCVLGGFVLHHGKLILLVVPTEYLIICGMALGTLFAANPMRVVIHVFKDLLAVFTGGGLTSKDYVQLLEMIYELLQLARKEGVLALESHVNDPKASAILSKYPRFLRDHHAVAFLCDTLKLFVTGALDARNMDELMERDLDALHHEELEPATALQKVADSLPAIGIVAAVLGIILTMQAIDQGAAAVGQKVAGALVGTFIGIFLAYGFVSPAAASLETAVNAKGRYYQCIRNVLTAAISGVNPRMAVEIGRRGIYASDRPSFEDLEAALKAVKGGG